MPWMLQECLTYEGEMDYKTYLDFVLALENRREPQALQYIFKLLDIRNLGYLDVFALHYFFRSIQVLQLYPRSIGEANLALLLLGFVKFFTQIFFGFDFFHPNVAFVEFFTQMFLVLIFFHPNVAFVEFFTQIFFGFDFFHPNVAFVEFFTQIFSGFDFFHPNVAFVEFFTQMFLVLNFFTQILLVLLNFFHSIVDFFVMLSFSISSTKQLT